jgi:hypothetical protein
VINWRLNEGSPFKLLRNSRKTGTVSSAPPQGLASSSTVWRRAAAPFALLVFVVILGVKGIFFLLDSRPAYFLGDSGSYLATATIEWIPGDRSFLYGYVIRGIAYQLHSLECLVAGQVLLSGIAAWLLFFALVRLFEVRFWIAAIFGLLCAIEPLQLLAERYVMTETCANILFAAQIVLALAYVRRGRLWTVLLAQAAGVLLIGIRISFLPEVMVNSVLVPLSSPQAILFFGSVMQRLRGRAWAMPKRQTLLFVAHLALVLLVTRDLIHRYKHWYGRLEHREAALFYSNGSFLISDFAPLVEPEDFPIAAMRDRVFGNLQIDRHDMSMRPAQHFSPGGLVRNFMTAFPNERQANDLETTTALHALFRQPLGALRLAFRTFILYFHPSLLKETLAIDEGAGQKMSDTMRLWLAQLYRVPNPQDFEPSLTKRWHMAAEPWYWTILATLCVSPMFLFVCRRQDRPMVLVCVVTALIFLEGVTLTVDRPTPRFLTTDAWLVLLLFGMAVNQVAARARMLG